MVRTLTLFVREMKTHQRVLIRGITWFELQFCRIIQGVVLRIGSEKAKAEARRPVGSYCNILGTRWWHIGLGRWQWRWWEMVTFWIYFEDRTYRNFWWVAYEVCEREESTILVLLPKYLLTLFSLGLSLWENYLCTPRASGVDMWLSLTSELVM